MTRNRSKSRTKSKKRTLSQHLSAEEEEEFKLFILGTVLQLLKLKLYLPSVEGKNEIR